MSSSDSRNHSSQGKRRRRRRSAMPNAQTQAAHKFKLRELAIVFAILGAMVGGVIFFVSAANSSPPLRQTGRSESANAEDAEVPIAPDDLRSELANRDMPPMQRAAVTYQNATGLNTVKTFRMKGTLHMGDEEHQLSFYFRDPNLMSRTLRADNGVERVDAFDGRVPWGQWRLVNGEVRSILLDGTPQGDAIRRNARVGSPLLVFFDEPSWFEVVGAPEYRFREYTVVRYSDPKSHLTEHLILCSQQTGLVDMEVLRETSEEGETRETIIKYQDYRPTEGIRFPFTIETLIDGEVFSVLKLNEVSVNPGVPEFIFEVPDDFVANLPN